ncbi:hypothetical protein BDY19DRAFT_901530 [Irpex rosettiformis]|uniref:Uncharacterized protein n=1 Tax=Irpex rosettiformis TaxID=378272 RepID=A0ACB8UJU2_9APHY|nr:hypothetical protein BDY19DRAFT_901530 [Irpex rosettiformis]
MDPYQATSDASNPLQTTDEHPTTMNENTSASLGTNLIAASEEPRPHESTKVEVTELKDPEVRDFGWNSPPRQVPSPLVHGLGNEDIYTLVRRFNKQIFHVKAAPHDPELLDLEVSENEEFSPDKLRATLERLYMTVDLGLAAFVKHIARLRSWNEPRRSAGFCIAYFAAWWFNAILPFLLATITVVVVDPPSRKLLFPPAPLALLSGMAGNVQNPKAGTLGSKDSLSGAPEAHKGEAVEQEARHFVSGIANLAISTAAGKGPGDDGNGNAIAGGEAEGQGETKSATAIEGAVPDPVNVVTGVTESKHLASGDVAAEDPAKKPVQDTMWQKMRPLMRILTNIADTWERFGNALSPMRPFPYWRPRLKIAGPLVPLIFVTYFMPIALPLIMRGVFYLTQKVPNWRDYLELRQSLLPGVPTNAQLTKTLLRITGVNESPLPPPPTSQETTVSDTEDDTDEFYVSEYDVDSDSEEYPATETIPVVEETGGERERNSPKRKPGRRIANALKKTVKAGVGGVLGVDHLKAKIGSEGAKQRLGALTEPPSTAEVIPDSSEGSKGSGQPEKVARVSLPGGEGPCVFSARVHGKKGHILIVNSATSPCLAFAYTKIPKSLMSKILPVLRGEKDRSELDIEVHPEFSIGLPDIVDMRKMGGYGWKEKLVIGWAMGREVLDGLEITDRQGKKYVFTAIKGRNEFFNRLIAMGTHGWEMKTQKSVHAKVAPREDLPLLPTTTVNSAKNMPTIPEKSPVTCHVLDSSIGKPAAGVKVGLYEFISSETTTAPVLLASGLTNTDGRCMQLWPEAAEDAVKIESAKLVAGRQYKMIFWVKEYFQETERKCFYPVVEIIFEVENPTEHYHIPLLISPYSYTTYRGS